MSLVHHDQRGTRAIEARHRLRSRQLFRAEEDELQLVRGEAVEGIFAPALAHGRVHYLGPAHIALLDGAHLVALERDEW